MKSSSGSNRTTLYLFRPAWIGMFLFCYFLSSCESKPKLTPEEITKIEEEHPAYTMSITLPLTQEMLLELAGSEAIKKTGLKSIAGLQIAAPEFEKLMLKAGVVSSNFFSDWIGFARIDQTKEAVAYAVLTFNDNTAVTGKYSMMATLRQGYTGGPMGSATERYIEVNQLKLDQRTVRLGKKVFESPRVVVPGERIVRMISPKESYVDDTYVIDFGVPPNTNVWISFYGGEKERRPQIDRDVVRYYQLKITNEAGRSIPFEGFNDKDYFHTRAVEKYLLKVKATIRTDNRPDRYSLEIVFGEPLGGDDYNDDWRTKWSNRLINR